MKKILLIILLILSAPLIISANDAIEGAIVKIFTVGNSPDYNQPWQMKGQYSTSGSGCVIDGNRILTNAHVVSNHAFIQVMKFGDTKKYVAQIKAIDHDADLALLTVDDREFFKGVQPVAIGGVPNLSDKVKVYGFPVGGEKLSITEGVVSRIETTRYSHSYLYYLSVQIDAAINPGNSGGPVVSNNKLVGIAFQALSSSQSIGYAIPTVMIKHFLSDLKDGKYEGFPGLGINYQGLESDSYRKKLGMKDKQTGVVVTDVAYGTSSWDVLKKGDVILNIDGVKIENDGTVKYGNKGRVDMTFITDQKYVGQSATVTVLRDKVQKKLTMKLKKESQIVPIQQYDIKPTYYIFGGIVFTELTGNYIQLFGGDCNAPAELLMHINGDVMKEDKRSVIVIRQVFADESNIGYHNNVNDIIENVNGENVVDMKDLIAKIEATKGEFLELGLEGGRKIVLDFKASQKASPGILERYRIPADRSDNLMTAEQKTVPIELGL